jgi:hypothetical protein
MRLKVLASAAILVSLLSLTAACSKSQTDSPKPLQPTQETTSEGSNPPAETVPLAPAANHAIASAGDLLPTHLNCELDAATAARIGALERQLADELLRYTAKHPRVVSLKETINRTKEDALSECLEPKCEAEDALLAERITELRRQLEGAQLAADPAKSSDTNPLYQNLKGQLRQAEVDKTEALRSCREGMTKEERRH